MCWRWDLSYTRRCMPRPIPGLTRQPVPLPSVIPMISCRHLTKRYGRHIAVQDLSFDVRPGAVTAFLGPNGAGKSTTLRLMLELDRGEGVTTFDGQRFAELSDPIRTVGAVLETRAWHPGRTARNHLRMLAIGVGCRNDGWTRCSRWSVCKT